MVESRGIPHLAKNERDVGHPSALVGTDPKGRTKRVRDMRGMRGKSCGLVDVDIGLRPKSVGTAVAGQAFAGDGTQRHELLQGSINALAGEVSVEEFSNLFPGQAIG